MGATRSRAQSSRSLINMPNCNYSKEQTIKIIINSIKRYEGRKRKRAAQGRPLRSTAAKSKKSKKSRIKNKLLGKST